MMAIMKKELSGYFHSVIGCVFLAIFVGGFFIYFLAMNLYNMNADFTYTMSAALGLFMIIIPVLTMRMFAEEARQKTDLLLFTSQVPTYRIVLAKYASAFILLLIGLIITMLFPFILSRFGEIPTAKIAGNYVGLVLFGASCISVCMFISILTDNQIIAAVVSFFALFLLTNLNGFAMWFPSGKAASFVAIAIVAIVLAWVFYDSTKNGFGAGLVVVICAGLTVMFYMIQPLWFDGLVGKVTGALALSGRMSNFSNGILSFADIIFYITYAAGFVYLTIHVIERRRWR